MSNTIRINQFLDDEGRIIHLPKKHSTKCAVLDYLAGKFEPSAEYTEHQVNDICNSWHTFGDPCLIRRELVDSGLLGRESDCTRYWRVAEESKSIETDAN